MTGDHAGGPVEGTSVPVLRIDSPEARELADLTSVILDLQFVHASCERLWTELQKESSEQDAVLVRAMWTAALVAYWRCFGKGKRAPLSRDDLSALPLQGEVLEWHDHLCDLRSKHIAHSVNPYEQMTVGVNAVHLAAERGGVVNTAAVTGELVKLLNDRFVAKQDKLISELRCRGPEATAGLLPLVVTIPGPEDGGRARR